MKKLLSLFLSLVLVVSSFFSILSVYASDNKIKIVSNNENIELSVTSDNFSSMLKYALSCCDNAIENDPYTIVLPSGQYNIYDNLVLRSNTILDMTAGTVLNLDTPTGTNIFKNPRVNAGYDDLVNFTMMGGTLRYTNSYQSTSCLVRLSHCRNTMFNNVTFISNGYAHCIELAACKNFVFDGCTFTCEVEPVKSSGEALQIDILDPDRHFQNMGPYDYTMNDGVTVKNCSFSNLRRGLGTQSIFVGFYQNNINIINNTFDDIDEAAISCSNYINSTIANNTITNTGWGIKFTMMKSTNYMDDVCFARDNGVNVYGTVNTNCNSVIRDNNISVKSTNVVPTPIPIESFGIDTSSSSAYTFPPNDYCVSNLTIKNNVINTSGYGIRLFDTKKSTVSSNTIKSTSKKEQGIYLSEKSTSNTISNNKISNFNIGVSIRAKSTNNSLNNNTISSINSHGVVVYEGASASVVGNKITSCGGHGVYFDSTSSSSNIKSNNLSSNKQFGLYLNKGVKATVYNNTYSKNKKGAAYSKGSKSYSFGNLGVPSSVSVSKKGTSATIKWKKVSNATGYIVYRATSKNGKYTKIATVSSSKQSYTNKKLTKKKTYYYKVCAIRKMNSVTVYSNNSSTKSIKI